MVLKNFQQYQLWPKRWETDLFAADFTWESIPSAKAANGFPWFPIKSERKFLFWWRWSNRFKSSTQENGSGTPSHPGMISRHVASEHGFVNLCPRALAWVLVPWRPASSSRCQNTYTGSMNGYHWRMFFESEDLLECIDSLRQTSPEQYGREKRGDSASVKDLINAFAMTEVVRKMISLGI